MEAESDPNIWNWLIDAARQRRPNIQLPPDLKIAPDLGDAWNQVAAVFGISPADLAIEVARAHGLQKGNLANFHPGDGSPLPERLCRELGLVPLWHDREKVCIALSDPRLTLDQIGQIRFAAGREAEYVVLSPGDIDTCQTRLFSETHRTGLGRESILDLRGPEPKGDNVTMVRLVRAIFESAIERNASDIHVHPFVGGGAIRFRIDGVLRRIATIPAETLAGLSRFIKANAGLDTNPFKPQDGRLRLKAGWREIDVRLSLLPAFDGDRIVCRLLDQSRNFSLAQSGLSATDQRLLRRLASHSAGLILLTGPTGSGKTSTLYALLSELNRVDVNIMTVEDPVEYVLPGISQTQVNHKQGISFADTLRAILRQDPDIVLIGEIRDAETARIAAQAALTGHLVLSTLHTNDALGALPRLVDLGLEPSIVADTLIGVVSQRLVRQMCEACRQPLQPPYLPGEEAFQRLTGEWPAYRPASCPECGYTGFRGRLPVIESVEVAPALRQAILRGESDLATLSSIAGRQRRAMALSARDWIASGKTSPAEVQRVLGLRFWHELATELGRADAGDYLPLEQDALNGQRLKVLLLSMDDSLSEKISAYLSYEVEQVADETQAATVLDQNQQIICLAFDARLRGDTPVEEWLTRLRTALAWAGLPALFILSEPDAEIQAVFERFEAPHVVLDDSGEGLAEAFLSMLRGGKA